MKKYFFLFLGLSLFVLSCSNDDDGNVPVSTVTQDFMWRAMNQWYFWQADVADLADDRFSTEAEYNSYLQSYTDPESFFLETLLFEEDRFSFENENYEELVSSLSGISQSNGVEFGLGLIGDTGNVFGFVQYIWPDSDASTKNISRGEFFTRVDGVQLTTGNYIELLFGDNSTYTLGMATVSNGVISDSAKEVTLTKIENQVEFQPYMFVILTLKIL